MATYTKIIYHLVFSTKNRVPVLVENRRRDLCKYIWGILKNKKCHLYRIGGGADHLHILTSLHPTVCVGNLIKDIKVASSEWIKENAVFAGFDHWQEGYGAFTQSAGDVDRLIEYIKNQKEHHRVKSFREEYLELLKEAGIEIDERFGI
jgi:REP element-mobilizing transposase RayT